MLHAVQSQLQQINQKYTFEDNLIRITTKNQQYPTMVFEPNGNSFVRKFMNKIKDSSSRFTLVDWNERIPYLRNQHEGSWLKAKKQCTQQICDAIRKLEEMGYPFPIGVDEIKFERDLETQLLLNRLHRHFTTSHRSLSETKQTYDDLNYFILVDKKRERQLFSDTVHIINECVHNIENFIITDRVEKFDPAFEYQIVFDSTQPFDPTDEGIDYFVDFEDIDYMKFSDSLEYDMWVPWHQIQGKCYWDGYFAYDDPTKWDISENIQYSGSIALGSRAQAKDPKIEAWLKSYGINPGPFTCGLPLAKLVEGRETLNWLLTQPDGILNLIESVTVDDIDTPDDGIADEIRD